MDINFIPFSKFQQNSSLNGRWFLVKDQLGNITPAFYYLHGGGNTTNSFKSNLFTITFGARGMQITPVNMPNMNNPAEYFIMPIRKGEAWNGTLPNIANAESLLPKTTAVETAPQKETATECPKCSFTPPPADNVAELVRFMTNHLNAYNKALDMYVETQPSDDNGVQLERFVAAHLEAYNKALDVYIETQKVVSVGSAVQCEITSEDVTKIVKGVVSSIDYAAEEHLLFYTIRTVGKNGNLTKSTVQVTGGLKRLETEEGKELEKMFQN